MNYKLLAHLAIAAAVCLAYPEIASACGCSGSTSFTMSQDDVNVYATATMSLSGGIDCDGGSVSATITAPDNTTSGAGAGVDPPPSATSVTATKVGTLNGTYSGGSTYWWTCDPANCYPPSGYFPPGSAQVSACWYPRYETTSYLGIEDPTINGHYGGRFVAVLDDHGGTTSYTGRLIQETFSQVDFTCYQLGDVYDPPSAAQLNAQASTWTANGNTYGLNAEDWIGESTGPADFYQNRLRNQGGAQQCLAWAALQTMSMSTCTPSGAKFYESHQVNFRIFANPDQMTASRANQTDKPAK